ncbi:ATP-binding cassette sub- A member 5 [Mactra antiquata]
MGETRFWSQFKALVWKNVLLKKRNKKQTFQELLMPIYFIAILAMIKSLVKPQTFPEIPHFPTYSLHSSNFTSLSGKLLVTPDTQFSHNVMKNVLKKLNSIYPQLYVSIEYYTSEDGILRAYQASSGGTVLAGVILNYKNASDNLSYALRFPFSNIASSDSGDLYQDQGNCRNGDGLDGSKCDVNSYLRTGFSLLQNAIDAALTKLVLNKTTDQSLPDVNVQMMPKPGYIPDTSYIQIMSSLYFIIAYSPFINFLTVNLVAEKEKKIKESMKMMGLSDSAFWLSWGCVYTTIIVMVTVVVVIIAQVSHFFANSSMVLFFFMLVLYGITIIGAAFSITPFFKQAQVAGGIASLSSMLISLLYLIVSLTRTYTSSGIQYTIPVWGRWILCLFSPVALALAIDQAIYLDITNPDGMTFSTATHGDFTVLNCIIMLIVDAVLYFILAIYLDNVIPGEYGPKQPPWYIFMKSYWCRRSRISVSSSFHNDGYNSTRHIAINGDNYVADGDDDDGNVEKVPDDMKDKVAVSIMGLTKEFSTNEGKVIAVNELSVDIYEDQITAILGHNGAGKTTTMNILTGLTGPTSGVALVRGLDVSDPNDMLEIRRMTGVCPQHNILFEDLTCYEHLQLFAGIKGINADTRHQEIEDALHSVDLTEQTNVLSTALSGGQKRKLSVAIAILGDPKIIFLDEPTAGMDPFSRRHLWSVLKDKKKGRIILLTTHFMDEADILADRKAIINKGSLRCCGSSLFLKNKFGIGYHLNMVIKNDCNSQDVLQFVSKYMNGADINREHGQELDIMLPMSQVSNFAELFKALEENISGSNNTLGVSSYGISMTTLEEVFLALEAETNPKDLEELGRGKSDISTKHASSETPATASPSATHTACVQVDDSSNDEIDENHSLLTGYLLHDDDNTFITVMESSFINISGQEQIGQPIFTLKNRLVLRKQLTIQRLKALLYVRYLRNRRNSQLIFYQLLLPLLFVIIGLMINKYSNPSLKGRDPASLEIGAYFYCKLTTGPPSIGRFGPLPSLLVHDNIGDPLSKTFLGNLSYIYVTENYSTDSTLLNYGPHYLGINLTTLHLQSSGLTTGYTAVYNDSAVHAIPAIINLISNSVLKIEEFIAGKGNNSRFISTSSLPWPTNHEAIAYNNAAFSSVILLAMAFTVIPAGFGVEIVRDRQGKVRSQLRIAGVSFFLYWTTFFIVDIIKYIIPAILIIIVTLIMQVKSLMQSGAIVTLILSAFTYIPNNLVFAYISSFAFNKWETAQAVQPLIFFFGGFIPFMPVSLIDSLSNSSTASILHILFCIVFPPYTIFGSLFYIDKVYRVAQMNFSSDSIPFNAYFTKDIILAIVIPLIEWFIFFPLLRILDVRDTGGDVKQALGCQGTQQQQQPSCDDLDLDIALDEDDDVKNERVKVAELMKTPEEPVAMVYNLKKEFSMTGSSGMMSCKNNKSSNIRVAVYNSSFSVEEGEVFGLLGPNGAGKSTTLNMMTADVAPSKGEVIIGGHSVRSNKTDAFDAMGFCPQHDALWDTITLEEHIRCYALLKGVPDSRIKSTIDYFVNQLKLEDHSSKYSKKLSGGTKRKLSYILSILGNPKVVLLDEPSTGMDPQSKRFVWDTISSNFKGQHRGAVLTTHYMEEADALCSRIAIMVNGKIQCIGSSQHLKSKYGSGYLLEIKLLTGNDQSQLEACMNNLKEYIIQKFPGAVCMEEFIERAQYKIPRDNVTSLARAFTILEEAKQHYSVEEYSFSQSTLEQVFLEFAKRQLDEGEADLMRSSSIVK